MTNRLKLGIGVVVIGLLGALAGLWIWTAAGKHHPASLQMRTFKVNPAVFCRQLNLPSGSPMTDSDIASAAQNFFKKAGVDLTAPRRSLAYNGKMELLFVKATAKELDRVEHAVAGLNPVAPQIHIKARFMDVPQGAFDSIWKTGTLVDKTETNTVEIIAANKFKPLPRQLERAGAETLAEPEVVTIGGRQTQMRAGEKSQPGPTMDVVPDVFSDGVTVHLQAEVTTIHSQTFRRFAAQANLWDGQTLALASLAPESDAGKRLVIFITATEVDPAGNRVHSDGELKSIEQKRAIPPQAR